MNEYKENQERLSQLKKINNFDWNNFKKSEYFLKNENIIRAIMISVANQTSFQKLTILEKEQLFDEIFMI